MSITTARKKRIKKF